MLGIPIELPFITTRERKNTPQKITFRTTNTLRIIHALLIPQRGSNNSRDKSGSGVQCCWNVVADVRQNVKTHTAKKPWTSTSSEVIWRLGSHGTWVWIGMGWAWGSGVIVHQGVALSEAVLCLCYHVEPETQRWKVSRSDECKLRVFSYCKLSFFVHFCSLWCV